MFHQFFLIKKNALCTGFITFNHLKIPYTNYLDKISSINTEGV